jgi:O-antigen/teichoic acid export membrane protein
MKAADSSRALVRDVVLVGAADVLKGLRFLVVLPLITKPLGAEAYGVWTQVKVSTVLLSAVALLGMNAAMLRLMSGDSDRQSVRDQFNSVIGAALVSSLTLAALLLAAVGSTAPLMFGASGAPVLVAATGVYLILEVLDQLVIAYLRATRQIPFHAAFTVAEVLGEVSVVWLMTRSGATLLGVVAGMVAWKAALVAVKLGRAWLQVGIGRPRASVLRGYLAFGIPLLVSTMAYAVLNYGDRYFINLFLGIGSVGLYAAAYAIGGLPVAVYTPIDYVMYPAIAAQWNGRRIDQAVELIETTLRWMILALVPVLVGFAVFIRPLIAIVTTPAFVVVAPAALVIAAGFALFSLGTVGERILVLANRQRMVSVLYVGLAAANAALNIALIPRLGLIGAALATLASFGAYAAITLVRARAYCRFAFPIDALWKTAVAAVAGALVAFPLMGTGIARLLLAGLAGGAVYAVGVVLLGAVRLDGMTLWPERLIRPPNL